MWQTAERSPEFLDRASGAPAPLKTETALPWDDDRLYAGFWLEEPYPTARQTERDSLIFLENNVEVFIDGGDCYYELEVNALGTIYEVFFIWRDAFHRFDRDEFDVHRRNAYTFGADFDRTPAWFWDGNHPRGTRWDFRDWDMPGLECRVAVQGALNDPSVRSAGWTVKIGIPWTSLAVLADSRPVPPNDGDVWRFILGDSRRSPLVTARSKRPGASVRTEGTTRIFPSSFTPGVFRR